MRNTKKSTRPSLNVNDLHATITRVFPNLITTLPTQRFRITTNHGIASCALDTYFLEDVRATYFNVLDFGAIGITLSARFPYLSSIHPRVFFGNKYCWYSVAIVAVLQVALTHIPGINSVIFQMRGMNGLHWGIAFLFMVVIFIVIEIEKAVRWLLRARGSDTDDVEYSMFDNINEATAEPSKGRLLQQGASRLDLVASNK